MPGQQYPLGTTVRRGAIVGPLTFTVLEDGLSIYSPLLEFVLILWIGEHWRGVRPSLRMYIFGSWDHFYLLLTRGTLSIMQLTQRSGVATTPAYHTHKH